MLPRIIRQLLISFIIIYPFLTASQGRAAAENRENLFKKEILVELPVDSQKVRIVSVLSRERIQSELLPVTDGKIKLELKGNPLFIEDGADKTAGTVFLKDEFWETLNELKTPTADPDAIYERDDRNHHSPGSSLKITKINENRKAAWIQKLKGLIPSRKYELSVWIKTADKDDFPKEVYVSAVFFMETIKNPIIFETPVFLDSRQWRNEKITFLVPEGFKEALICLEIGAGKGSVWWDDAVIRELTAPVVPEVSKFEEQELDRYGGWKKIKGRTTGFFHTERINNRWWIVTPEGNGFIVKGLQHMHRKNDDLKKIEQLLSMPADYSNIKERYRMLEQNIPALAGKYNVNIGELLTQEEAKRIRESLEMNDLRTAQQIDNVFKKIAAVIIKSPSVTEWISASEEKLKEWGFNTVSHNSLFKKFAYDQKVSPSLWGFPFINPEVRVPVKAIQSGSILDMWVFPDVFDKRFKEILDSEFKQTGLDHKEDPWLLGYFLGNELPWEGDPKEGITLFDMFFALAPHKEGKKAAIDFLKKQYNNNVESFNDAWGAGIKDFDELANMHKLEIGKKTAKCMGDKSLFLGLVAEIYFRLNYEIVKKYDPNHMILGVRFRGHAVPKEVLQIIGKYVDVVSFQLYDPIPPLEWLDESCKYHNKPVLISEFSFKAQDSGLPNTIGAGFVLKTQKDRALWFERYVSHLLTSPNMIGEVWYQYMDDMPSAQQENSNFGLVNSNDIPYSDLIKSVKQVNSRVYRLSASNNISMKQEDNDMTAQILQKIEALINDSNRTPVKQEEYLSYLKDIIGQMAEKKAFGYVKTLNFGENVSAYQFEKEGKKLYILW